MQNLFQDIKTLKAKKLMTNSNIIDKKGVL